MFSSSTVNASSYGENYAGETLYALLVKNGDIYTLDSISTKKGNVRLNDLSPNFSTTERNCGHYYANGKPEKDSTRALECEEAKDSEFLNISINTVSNVFFTAFTLGINVAAGGVHMRHATFDEDKYKSAISQIFEKGQVNRKKIIEDYTNFVQRDKNLASEYKTNLEKLKVNFSLNDKTGFFKKPPMNNYVLNALEIPQTKSKSSMPFQDFIAFHDRATADNFFADKYAKINFPGYDGYIDGFKVTLDPATSIMTTTPTIEVVANITEKKFSNVFPKFRNEDRFLKVDFDGDKLHFVNKTENFIQVLTISMYYDTYIKSLTLANRPIELAPMASTLDPLTLKEFIDPRMKGLSTYMSISARQAKETTLNFGFAIKYRIVEQNKDMTQYKTIKYNLYDLLAGTEGYPNTPSNIKPVQAIKQTKQPRTKRQL